MSPAVPITEKNVPLLTEANIQRAVLEYLNTIPDMTVWRRNVGTREWQDAKGRRRFMKFGEAGMSDLWGLVKGIHFECEIKRPGRVPSEDQNQWIEFINRHGGIAFWADSLRSCVEQLRKAFVANGWIWRKEWEVW